MIDASEGCLSEPGRNVNQTKCVKIPCTESNIVFDDEL